MLKLLSGQGIAFVIGYIANIVLMRMYPDEMWGTVDYIITWTTILVPITSLRYEDALMLAEDKRQSAHAYLLAVITVIGSCIGILALLSFSGTIIDFFAANKIGRWSLFIPLAIFVHRMAKIAELWLSKHDHYTHISAGQVVTVGSMTGVRLIAGALKPSTGGLIWGFVAGYGLTFLVYTRRLYRTLKESLQGAPTWKELGFIAVRYKRFALFTMPATLVSALIMKGPFLILKEYLELGIYGQFTRGFNVLFVPLSLLAASIAQVFFVLAVKTNRDGTLGTFSSNVHSKLVLMSIYPTVALMIAGGDIFQVLFGIQWRASGDFLLFMAPWIMLSIVASPMTRLFDVLERQRLELTIALISAAIVITALVLAGRSNDASVIILYLGVVGSLVRMGQIILLLRLSGATLSATFKPYLRYSAILSPVIIGIMAVRIMNNPVFTLIAVVGGGIIFGLYILKTERLLAHKKPAIPHE